MRLIFKGKYLRIIDQLKKLNFLNILGKILKDELTLEEYKIENGVTVHLVKGKSAASGAPTTSTSESTATSTSQASAG